LSLAEWVINCADWYYPNGRCNE